MTFKKATSFGNIKLYFHVIGLEPNQIHGNIIYFTRLINSYATQYALLSYSLHSTFRHFSPLPLTRKCGLLPFFGSNCIIYVAENFQKFIRPLRYRINNFSVCVFLFWHWHRQFEIINSNELEEFEMTRVSFRKYKIFFISSVQSSQCDFYFPFVCSIQAERLIN